MNPAGNIFLFLLFLSIACKSPPIQNVAENPALLTEAFQTKCLHLLSKTSDSSTPAGCAKIDSIKIQNDSIKISVIQFGYCSSKFSFSIQESRDSILITAEDTSKSISRCGCPFRLDYSIQGTSIGNKNIIHVGMVHPPTNAPCYLTIN